MEEQLLKFSRQSDTQKLKNFVHSISLDKLYAEISRICVKDNGSVILQNLFKGLTDSPKCQEKRAQITSEVLSNIRKKSISSRLSSKLVSILAAEVEHLSTSHLISLTNTCLQMMQNEKEKDTNSCWKELIPKFLNILVEKDEIEHDGTRMTGVEFKSGIVTAIYINEWKNSMIANLASMFIDMPLSTDEHLKVVNKLCKSIRKLKLDEIPPVTHEILLLTKEQNSIPLFVTLGEFFDEKLYSHIKCENDEGMSQVMGTDGIPLKELQIVEGTVLYHIYTAASSLGTQSVKNFLKILKECLYQPQFILRPFFVTLLLSVSRISYTFEEEVLSILKSALLRAVSEDEKVFESAWLESVVPASIKVQEVLDKIAQNCFRDRDRILTGLVSLAFTLLGVPKTRGKDVQCETVWKIGSTILVNLIQKYPHVTDTIFQNLVNQISQAHESTQYTDCLARMASKRPLSLLDCSPVIMQLLGNICARLPGVVGQRVVAALLPLTKMSPSLRDNVIIFLRKALFGDKPSKQMSVYGFLELLKDLRITDIRTLSQSMSQNYVGITQIYSGTYNNTGGTTSNEGMCLEILSILKQVFEYHYEVKIVLYKGIYDCFYANPKLGTHILDNLKGRLDKFYRGKETPPLDFQRTVTFQNTSVVIQEPIHHLVFAIALIAAKTEDDFTGRCKFSEVLDSLCEKMSDSDIQHFDFEKECFDNILDDEPENQIKHEKIRHILGVYEALMGFLLCTWKQDTIDHGRKLNSLFKGYSRLSDYAKSLGKPDKKKMADKKSTQKDPKEANKAKDKTKLSGFKFPPTVLNLKCASRLLAVLNGAPVNWASELSTEIIKGKRDLHRYAFNITLELISQARLLSPSELSRSNYMLQYASFVGRVLYLRCVSRLPDVKEFDVPCAVLALECFSELLTLVCFHFKSKLSTFLTEIGAVDRDLKLQLKSIISAILEQLRDLLGEEADEDDGKDETQTRKLSLLLISIASFLCNQLPRGAELQQILSAVRLICKESKVQNPNVAKALLSLLLNVYMKCKASGGMMLDLALCLCDCMILIDDEMEISKHEEYALINKKTANQCLMAMCEAVRSLVSEVEWMISRFKAELSVLSFPSEEPMETKQEHLQEREREMCRHLNFSIKILSTICTIAVLPGPLADTVLKEIGNLYSKLGIVTKYFILKVTKHNQILHSTRFEKTIKMADHELTKNMYCFTEHIIADGAANSDDPPPKKQKKDAAALRNKVMKETKIIPKVIYEKEQFQKFVLQLSNKSKVDLELKHTMARDYRLYAKQVKEIIEKENIQLEEDLMDVDYNTPEESTQASKRVKTQE